MRHGHERPGLILPVKIPPELSLFFALGWSLTIWMVGGILLGHLADVHFGSKPWGMIAGAVLGMAGSGYSFYQIATRADRKSDRGLSQGLDKPE
jgi:F0F1-type ATP synthase assembly protein I